MAEISAALVVKLRKMSSQGMMDCKKALEEANGNMDEAMAILRKKGLATLAKRAERETTQGLVVGKISPDGKTAVLASLCCETDFVSNSDDFKAAAEKLAEYGMVCAKTTALRMSWKQPSAAKNSATLSRNWSARPAKKPRSATTRNSNSTARALSAHIFTSTKKSERCWRSRQATRKSPRRTNSSGRRGYRDAHYRDKAAGPG